MLRERTQHPDTNTKQAILIVDVKPILVYDGIATNVKIVYVSEKIIEHISTSNKLTSYASVIRTATGANDKHKLLSIIMQPASKNSINHLYLVVSNCVVCRYGGNGISTPNSSSSFNRASIAFDAFSHFSSSSS